MNENTCLHTSIWMNTKECARRETQMKANGGDACLNMEELISLYGDDILRLCLLYLGDRQLA